MAKKKKKAKEHSDYRPMPEETKRKISIANYKRIEAKKRKEANAFKPDKDLREQIAEFLGV